MPRTAIRLVLAAALALAGAAGAAEPRYSTIPGASFETVFPPDGKRAAARVEAFELHTVPVTNAEFEAFVAAHPQWRRGAAPAVFADANYLAHWTTAETAGAALAQLPVTHVSWFAADAYCHAQGGRLPTWHEWELAAAADETRADARSDPAWRERMLTWYSRPSTATLSPVGKTPANVHGVRDLHGLVWEWVDDHASLMVSADNRNQGDPDLLKFCGAGALSVADRENYAVLMRIAMLSSLSAASTTKNVGFRCMRPPGAGAKP